MRKRLLMVGPAALVPLGEGVKETKRIFEEAKARLQQLYEHWEEAVELN